MNPIRPAARLLAARVVAAACLIGSLAGTAPAVAADPGTASQQPAKPASTAPAAKPKATAPAAKPATKAVPAKSQPAGPAAPAARPVPIPQGCADLTGVQRQICVECDGVALHKRVVCQQRVFWTTCKGKRLFEDAYCQSLQETGRPPGEGG